VVLEENQAQHDVFVLGDGIVLAELVGGLQDFLRFFMRHFSLFAVGWEGKGAGLPLEVC